MLMNLDKEVIINYIEIIITWLFNNRLLYTAGMIAIKPALKDNYDKDDKWCLIYIYCENSVQSIEFSKVINEILKQHIECKK